MTDLCRCPWVDLAKPIYVAYHDEEWGVPVRDDRTMFEFLTLEAAQAGLSWYTILSRREGYRRAFAGFDPEQVAAFERRSTSPCRCRHHPQPGEGCGGHKQCPRLSPRAGRIRKLHRTYGALSMAVPSCTTSTPRRLPDHLP